MIIENDTKLDFSNVLIKPKRSTLKSRSEVDLYRQMTFKNYKPDFPENSREVHFNSIPIMGANMDGVGTFTMADKLASMGMFTCLVKTYTINELVSFFDVDDEIVRDIRRNRVAMSIGATDQDYLKFRNVMELTDGAIKYLCVDVANGYTEMFSEFIYQLRINHPNIVIIAGNVVTGDMTQELILNGADIVKVGIGPGSVCTTRIKTGVGYPQLSAIIECADAAHGLGGHIIADGGCTSSGDVAKAFGAGADFVMMGGMLAGHDEGGGEEIFEDDNPTPIGVRFYGMSSETANEKHFGGLKDYRAAEGREVVVPYRGAVENTVKDILGGIRSSCTYVGANRIKDLTKCTTFVIVADTHNRVYERSS
jgi:GMP reductase